MDEEIKKVDEEIKKVEEEIKKVKEEIKKVEEEIKKVENEIEKVQKMIEEVEDEGTVLESLKEEKQQLRRDKEQLRRKEEQLREEKKQLRNEKERKEKRQLEEPPPKKPKIDQYQEIVPTIMEQHYIERECANVTNIAGLLERGKSVAFVGPKGCGKSTTLLKVHNVMKEDHKVAVTFIDLKGETSKRLESLIGTCTHYFIDNAQELARNDQLAKTLRLVLRSKKSVCCAFSPVVLDPRGCSLLSADIGMHVTVYFTPFTDNELDWYVSTYKLSKADIQERTMNIPAFLDRLFAVSPPATKFDIHIEIFYVIEHQLMYLRNSYQSLCDLVDDTQNALITAVIFGCDSLDLSQRMRLLNTGFAYKKAENHGEDNASINISLVYPKTLLVDHIESHVRSMAHAFVQFDKGAGFEFMFYAAAQKGIFAKSLLSGDEEKIPPVTDAWIQPSYGTIPHYFGPNYQGCLMVKLAEKHAAIDFVIADCSGVGVASRRLYLIQVSVQDYDQRKDRKYSAIDQHFYQLNMTLRQCYTSKFNIPQQWYYVYVSPPHSTFSSVKSGEVEKFYSVHLKY